MTMTLSPVAVMGVAIASGDNRGQLILVQVFRYMLDSAVASVHRHSITLATTSSVCRQSRKPEYTLFRLQKIGEIYHPSRERLNNFEIPKLFPIIPKLFPIQ